MRYLLLLFFTTLAAVEDTQQLTVKLATENHLSPLYLTSFYKEKPAFNQTYLTSLHQILSHDLNHNGTTRLVPETALLKQMNGSFDQMADINDWKNQQIFYLVKPQMKDKTLTVKVLSVISRTIKTLQTQPLTGQLATDRRQVHLLADAIHKALFNTPGIAGTRILYTVRIENPLSSEVWEVDADGSNPRQITRNSGYAVTPTNLPDNKHFLYVGYKTGQPKIYVASRTDGIGKRISYFKGNQLMPAVSENQIAFVSDYTTNPDLFLASYDQTQASLGKPQQIFAHKRGTQGTPSFSPDGKKIAFVSNKDGSPRIYLMDIPKPGHNGKPTLITKYNPGATAPSWSPDGKKIAYCAKAKGVRQIWVYDLEKKTERQLTSGTLNKENPSWAPDSLHLVFNTTGKSGSDLYTINLNQLEPVRITSGLGEKRFPAW